MAGSEPGTARVDGRTARSERTRGAIVDACISLVEQGDYRPTAPRIAEEAGVSVRSVFLHYDDLDSLFTAVAERAVERVSRLLLPVDPSLPLAGRIDTFVRQRSQLLEAVTAIRKAAAVHEPFSDTIADLLDDAHAFLRAEVISTFAVELDESEEPCLLDAMDTALGWATWDSLRHRSKLDFEAASSVVGLMVVRLLGVVE